MSERPEIQTKPVVKVARVLREIENLYAALMVQAIHNASARIDGTSLPGGEAMVALANVGSPGEWAELVAAAEFHHLAQCPRLDHTRCRYAEHVLDDENSGEPILQTLLFWSEAWRTEAGYELGRPPSIATEVNFIRGNLNWAWDNLIEWQDFADDIYSAKTRLENLLSAGERAERGAPCLYDGCNGARLVRKLVPYRDEEGCKAWKFSDWHCPKCKRSWNEGRYAAMVTAAHEATKYEDIDGDTWCTTDFAARQVGRSESTIRQWLHKGHLATVCIVAGKRVRYVRLRDVEARHELSVKRRRAA